MEHYFEIPITGTVYTANSCTISQVGNYQVSLEWDGEDPNNFEITELRLWHIKTGTADITPMLDFPECDELLTYINDAAADYLVSVKYKTGECGHDQIAQN